jgi:hypothetical protein
MTNIPKTAIIYENWIFRCTFEPPFRFWRATNPRVRATILVNNHVKWFFPIIGGSPRSRLPKVAYALVIGLARSGSRFHRIQNRRWSFES